MENKLNSSIDIEINLKTCKIRAFRFNSQAPKRLKDYSKFEEFLKYKLRNRKLEKNIM